MPLLPTVASICGIISCFQSAASLFTAVNSRKEATKRHKEVQDEKAEAKANEKASKAITKGKSDVQHEYDQSVARIGPQFANGDRMYYLYYTSLRSSKLTATLRDRMHAIDVRNASDAAASHLRPALSSYRRPFRREQPRTCDEHADEQHDIRSS